MLCIIPYILFLILTEGVFSCLKASGLWLLSSHDALSRWLVGDGVSVCADLRMLPAGGCIVIDDTVINKQFSKKIEGVSFVYSSSEKKVIPGLTCILVLWVCGKQVFVLDVLVWRKGRPTKNELVRQTLTRLYCEGLQPIKGNRYFNGMPVSQHRYFGAKGMYGRLRGVGHAVQIVKDGDRYLVTNDMQQHTSRSLAKRYGNRWVIEVVFRDLKTVLHLEECSSRSLKAQTNHIKACLAAYILLKNLFPDKSLQAAQRQFIQRYRQGNFMRNQPLQNAA